MMIGSIWKKQCDGITIIVIIMISCLLQKPCKCLYAALEKMTEKTEKEEIKREGEY